MALAALILSVGTLIGGTDGQNHALVAESYSVEASVSTVRDTTENVPLGGREERARADVDAARSWTSTVAAGPGLAALAGGVALGGRAGSGVVDERVRETMVPSALVRQAQATICADEWIK